MRGHTSEKRHLVDVQYRYMQWAWHENKLRHSFLPRLHSCRPSRGSNVAILSGRFKLYTEAEILRLYREDFCYTVHCSFFYLSMRISAFISLDVSRGVSRLQIQSLLDVSRGVSRLQIQSLLDVSRGVSRLQIQSLFYSYILDGGIQSNRTHLWVICPTDIHYITLSLIYTLFVHAHTVIY